jgi:cysteine desulfurase
VLDAMLPFQTLAYGNPHSRTHAYGWEAESAVEAGRAQIASLIGADAREIIFTSGATESNNLAIKGVGRFYKAAGTVLYVLCRILHTLGIHAFAPLEALSCV